MDVTLPNGAVIRGVPTGTSKADIQSKAIAGGLATAQDFQPQQQDSLVQAATRGVDAGKAIAAQTQPPRKTISGSEGIFDFTKTESAQQLSDALAASNLIDEEAATYGALQGGTLGFSDEIGAAADAAWGGITNLFGEDDGTTFGERYAAAKGESQSQHDVAKGRSPTSYGLGEFAGGIGSGAAAEGIIAKQAGKSLGKRLGTAAAVGATEGAITGAGSSTADITSGDFVSDVASGAALNAVFSAGGEYIGKKLGDVISSAPLDTRAGQREVQRVIKEAVDEETGLRISKQRQEAEATIRREVAKRIQKAQQDIREGNVRFDTTEEFMEDIRRNGVIDPALGNADVRIGDEEVARIHEQVRKEYELSPEKLQGIRDDAEDTIVKKAAKQLEEVQGASRARPVLADADLFQELAMRSNLTRQIDDNLREGIAKRQSAITREFVNTVDAPIQSEVAGRTVPISERVGAGAEGAGTVNLRAFSEGAKREGNAAAKELYKQAYARELTQQQYEELQALVDSSPRLRSAINTGIADAKDINLAQGITGNPTAVQVLDEASKSLGSQLKNVEAGQSRAAISGIKKQLDSRIEAIAPELMQARKLSKQGQATQGFVEGGKDVIDSQSIDAVDDFMRTLPEATGSVEARQALLGAGRGVREAVFNRVQGGTRDAVTGELLSSRQRNNYNRILDKAGSVKVNRGVVDKLLKSDKRALRAKNISETDRKTWQQELRSSLQATARDASAWASLAALIAAPAPIGFAILANRVGQAAASRANQTTLARQLQQTLFQPTSGLSGATTQIEKREYLSALLSGDFSSVPAKVLQDMARNIANALGIVVAGNQAETRRE